VSGTRQDARLLDAAMADLLPAAYRQTDKWQDRAIDLQCELSGAIHWIETAAKCLADGDTAGLALCLTDYAKRAKTVLEGGAA